jgi:hypothetical protein
MKKLFSFLLIALLTSIVIASPPANIDQCQKAKHELPGYTVIDNSTVFSFDLIQIKPVYQGPGYQVLTEYNSVAIDAEFSFDFNSGKDVGYCDHTILISKCNQVKNYQLSGINDFRICKCSTCNSCNLPNNRWKQYNRSYPVLVLLRT